MRIRERVLVVLAAHDARAVSVLVAEEVSRYISVACPLLATPLKEMSHLVGDGGGREQTDVDIGA